MLGTRAHTHTSAQREREESRGAVWVPDWVPTLAPAALSRCYLPVLTALAYLYLVSGQKLCRVVGSGRGAKPILTSFLHMGIARAGLGLDVTRSIHLFTHLHNRRNRGSPPYILEAPWKHCTYSRRTRARRFPERSPPGSELFLLVHPPPAAVAAGAVRADLPHPRPRRHRVPQVGPYPVEPRRPLQGEAEPAS